jgi:hypothetical protein
VYGYYRFSVRPKLPKLAPGHAVGVDPRGFFANPLFWLLAVIAFAAGFSWQFHAAIHY